MLLSVVRGAVRSVVRGILRRRYTHHATPLTTPPLTTPPLTTPPLTTPPLTTPPPLTKQVCIFLTTARLTQLYAELFNGLGVSGVLEIHSRKSQPQRTRVAEQFRAGSRMLLFTSDVSARGMDYPDVTAVVQVGLPSDKAQYVHRLGRTARAGKAGGGQPSAGRLRAILPEPAK